jgi:hypothetical protein
MLCLSVRKFFNRFLFAATELAFYSVICWFTLRWGHCGEIEVRVARVMVINVT